MLTATLVDKPLFHFKHNLTINSSIKFSKCINIKSINENNISITKNYNVLLCPDNRFDELTKVRGKLYKDIGYPWIKDKRITDEFDKRKGCNNLIICDQHNCIVGGVRINLPDNEDTLVTDKFFLFKNILPNNSKIATASLFFIDPTFRRSNKYNFNLLFKSAYKLVAQSDVTHVVAVTTPLIVPKLLKIGWQTIDNNFIIHGLPCSPVVISKTDIFSFVFQETNSFPI